MKYCSHCGAELLDEAEICIHCGCRVANRPSQNNTGNQTLGLIAKIFMIITMVSQALAALGILALTAIFAITGEIIMAQPPTTSSGSTAEAELGFAYVIMLCIIYTVIVLIPLAWRIPMTVSVHKKMRDKQPISVAFKVCTLLFVNLVSGILLLCMRDEPTTNTY